MKSKNSIFLPKFILALPWCSFPPQLSLINFFSKNFDDLDAQKIRKRLKLSQSQFARLMGISVGTLKNWEQGRRKPDGPARVLLGVAAFHSEVLPDVVGL